ncbi:hypothetical protein [Polaribacter atrinae]|uniref:hypothetical protein n=1 Tax=Polaribacter atrinae TaxID=1333662 RepID=UPI002490F1E0|nr:hypothetical protein [Polaribacter atrinae]
MQNVNFIKHLKGVFIQFSKDNRLNPTHISLYIALFQIWNNNRFLEEFYINREEVMRFSKIGSKSTYHKCIKDLSHWKYIIYYPSHNPYKGSKIKMFKFETSTGQALVHSNTKIETSSGQALVSINKHIQTNRNNKNINKLDQPKNEKEVIDFFKKENWPKIEGQKFYNHYQGIGWKVGGKTKIVNWQATAKNWMIKSQEIKTNKTQNAVSQEMDNLKTTKNKNYNEPL